MLALGVAVGHVADDHKFRVLNSGPLVGSKYLFGRLKGLIIGSCNENAENDSEPAFAGATKAQTILRGANTRLPDLLAPIQMRLCASIRDFHCQGLT